MKEYIIKVDENKKDVTGGMPLMDKPKELVRYKDCEKQGSYDCHITSLTGQTSSDDWFCADGERREEDA